MNHKEKETESICPASAGEWRQWLQQNHNVKQSVWLIQHKKKSNKPSLSWSEAVDEALCFGWIDSVRKTIDEERYVQFFSRRKPTGNWSKINKEKIELLIEKGLMTQAGHDSIETAKQNGSWSVLDDVEALKIPKDLTAAFKIRPGSRAYFSGLSKSVKKMILQWVVLAKRPETRQKRIDEIAELAGQQMKPKQFR